MATAEANEREYQRLFLDARRSVDTSKPVTFRFISRNQSIEVADIEKIDVVGGAGKKTDLFLRSNILGNSKTISIKDNSSVFWDSSDVYIRRTFGDVVRRKIIELSQASDSNNNLVAQFGSFQRQTNTGRSRNYDVKLSNPIGFTVNEAEMERAIFGTPYMAQRVGNNINFAQYVIRHEISRNDVNVSGNIITFNVNTIYDDISDIPANERPALYIYNADRNTFRMESVDLGNTQGFRGIRGAFRTYDAVVSSVGRNLFSI